MMLADVITKPELLLLKLIILYTFMSYPSLYLSACLSLSLTPPPDMRSTTRERERERVGTSNASPSIKPLGFEEEAGIDRFFKELWYAINIGTNYIRTRKMKLKLIQEHH